MEVILCPFFMEYNHSKTEAKWQKKWEEDKTFSSEIDYDKEKLYVLDMFPYPSGSGLHVGHPLGYTATDIYCRYKRLQGYNVLHPMGWDAFGLPAEQYAIKTGTHPKETTKENIKNFKRQIKSLGFSYDWEREINTTDQHVFHPSIRVQPFLQCTDLFLGRIFQEVFKRKTFLNSIYRFVP